MQLLIVSEGCIWENRWPFWLLISIILLQFIFLIIILATFCCVIFKKNEEALGKKAIQSRVKQRTQSLLSPKRPTSPKVIVKSKKKSKKSEGEKQKEVPKQDLETAAYLTQTFYPIPLQPKGSQGIASLHNEKLPESILVVRPNSDEKLTPVETEHSERPLNFNTAKAFEHSSPASPPTKKEKPIIEDIHVETYPIITISTGSNANDIESVLRQSIRREVQLDYPKKQNKVDSVVRHIKKSE